MANSTLPLGEFPLTTSEEEIDRAYHDDKALLIQFSGHDIRDNYKATVVLPLHATLLHYKGHTTEPTGYGVRVFKRPDNSLWVELTARSAK